MESDTEKDDSIMRRAKIERPSLLRHRLIEVPPAVLARLAAAREQDDPGLQHRAEHVGSRLLARAALPAGALVVDDLATPD
eukprot:6789341-Pyramimonas_sp.AAC.1